MKILHCCLAAFYIDDYSYQENILPRLHKEAGHAVEIVASTDTYLQNVKRGYADARSYFSRDGIPVTRLAYVSYLPRAIARKLRLYEGLERVLDSFRPDLVYLHDCQFLDVAVVRRYVKKSGAKLVVDCHTDYVNSARGFLSRWVLHRLVYRWCVWRLLPLVHKFYATLPIRSDFLVREYGVPREMIDLLPFGADDSRVDAASKAPVRAAVRQQLGIPDDAVVIVTGGKLDRRKNIHLLAEVFRSLKANGALQNMYLLIFGMPDSEMATIFDELAYTDGIIHVNWVPSEDIYKYFWCADLGFFPGTHSVLWEEAVGLGLPCVFKRWTGIEHIDLKGNCVLLDEVNHGSVGDVLLRVDSDSAWLAELSAAAQEKGADVFSYVRIAAKVVDDVS